MITKFLRKKFDSIKICAVFTAACFMISTLGANLYAIPMSEKSNQKYEDVFNKASSISNEYGKITSSKDANSDITVINIQDLHCHPQTQRNISKIIGQISDKYNLKSIYVEGGYGNIDTSWLNQIKDEKTRKEIIERLVEDGILTGSEYYKLTSNNDNVELKGIDEEKLHQDNIKRLSFIIENQNKYKELSKKINREISFLEQRYVNIRNKRFNGNIEDYLSNKIDTKRFYRQLIKYVKDINANPDNYNNITAIRLEDYPNITKFMTLRKVSKNINVRDVTQQLQAVINELKNRLPYNIYTKLLKETENFSDSQKVVELITLLCDKEGIDLDNKYKSLNEFLKSNEINRELNTVELVYEERQLITEIRKALSYNNEEYEITFVSDFSRYFQDYLEYKLTDADWKYFESGYKQFRQLYGKYAVIDRIKEIESDIAELNKYYEINDIRNEIFVNNLLQDKTPNVLKQSKLRQDEEILKQSKEVIIAVTGGFHSQALEDMLQAKEVNTIVITPSIFEGIEKATKQYKGIIKEQSKEFQHQALAYKIASCTTYSHKQKLLYLAALELVGNDTEKLKSILGDKVDLTALEKEVKNSQTLSEQEQLQVNKIIKYLETAVDITLDLLPKEGGKIIFAPNINEIILKVSRSLVRAGIFLSDGPIFGAEEKGLPDLKDIPAEYYSRMHFEIQKALNGKHKTIESKLSVSDASDSLDKRAHIWEEIAFRGGPAFLTSIVSIPLFTLLVSIGVGPIFIAALIAIVPGLGIFWLSQRKFVEAHIIKEWIKTKDLSEQEKFDLKVFGKFPSPELRQDFKNYQKEEESKAIKRGLKKQTGILSAPYIVSVLLSILLPLSVPFIIVTNLAATMTSIFYHHQHNERVEIENELVQFELLISEDLHQQGPAPSLNSKEAETVVASLEKLKAELAEDKEKLLTEIKTLQEKTELTSEDKNRIEELGKRIVIINTIFDQYLDKINIDSLLEEIAEINKYEQIFKKMDELAGRIDSYYGEKKNQLEDIFLNIVENKLCARLEELYHDGTTKDHVKRVMKYANVLYSRANPSATVREKYRFMIETLMHDIGKNIVPDEILNKPGRLTDEEFKIMHRHVLFGQWILKYSVLSSFASMAENHHDYKANDFVDSQYREFETDPNERQRIEENAQLCKLADIFQAVSPYIIRPYQYRYFHGDLEKILQDDSNEVIKSLKATEEGKEIIDELLSQIAELKNKEFAIKDLQKRIEDEKAKPFTPGYSARDKERNIKFLQKDLEEKQKDLNDSLSSFVRQVMYEQQSPEQDPIYSKIRKEKRRASREKSFSLICSDVKPKEIFDFIKRTKGLTEDEFIDKFKEDKEFAKEAIDSIMDFLKSKGIKFTYEEKLIRAFLEFYFNEDDISLDNETVMMSASFKVDEKTGLFIIIDNGLKIAQSIVEYPYKLSIFERDSKTDNTDEIVFDTKDIIDQDVVIQTAKGEPYILHFNSKSFYRVGRGFGFDLSMSNYGIKKVNYDRNGNIIGLVLEKGTKISSPKIDGEIKSVEGKNFSFSLRQKREMLRDSGILAIKAKEKGVEDEKVDEYIDNLTEEEIEESIEYVYLDDDEETIQAAMENAIKNNKLIIIHIFRNGVNTQNLSLWQLYKRYQDAYKKLQSDKLKNISVLSDNLQLEQEVETDSQVTFDFFLKELLKNHFGHGNSGLFEYPIACYIAKDGSEMVTYDSALDLDNDEYDPFYSEEFREKNITRNLLNKLMYDALVSGDGKGRKIMNSSLLRKLEDGKVEINGLSFYRARVTLKLKTEEQKEAARQYKKEQERKAEARPSVTTQKPTADDWADFWGLQTKDTVSKLYNRGLIKYLRQYLKQTGKLVENLTEEESAEIRQKAKNYRYTLPGLVYGVCLETFSLFSKGFIAAHGEMSFGMKIVVWTIRALSIGIGLTTAFLSLSVLPVSTLFLTAAIPAIFGATTISSGFIIHLVWNIFAVATGNKDFLLQEELSAEAKAAIRQPVGLTEDDIIDRTKELATSRDKGSELKVLTTRQIIDILLSRGQKEVLDEVLKSKGFEVNIVDLIETQESIPENIRIAIQNEVEKEGSAIKTAIQSEIGNKESEYFKYLLPEGMRQILIRSGLTEDQVKGIDFDEEHPLESVREYLEAKNIQQNDVIIDPNYNMVELIMKHPVLLSMFIDSLVRTYEKMKEEDSSTTIFNRNSTLKDFIEFIERRCENGNFKDTWKDLRGYFGEIYCVTTLVAGEFDGIKLRLQMPEDNNAVGIDLIDPVTGIKIQVKVGEKDSDIINEHLEKYWIEEDDGTGLLKVPVLTVENLKQNQKHRDDDKVQSFDTTEPVLSNFAKEFISLMYHITPDKKDMAEDFNLENIIAELKKGNSDLFLQILNILDIQQDKYDEYEQKREDILSGDSVVGIKDKINSIREDSLRKFIRDRSGQISNINRVLAFANGNKDLIELIKSHNPEDQKDYSGPRIGVIGNIIIINKSLFKFFDEETYAKYIELIDAYISITLKIQELKEKKGAEEQINKLQEEKEKIIENLDVLIREISETKAKLKEKLDRLAVARRDFGVNVPIYGESAILPENMEAVNAMLQQGRSALRVAAWVAFKEFKASMKPNFVDLHRSESGKQGASKLREFITRYDIVETDSIVTRIVKTILGTIVKGASIVKHIAIDYKFIKASGIKEAIAMFGKDVKLNEEGQIEVAIVDGIEQLQDSFTLVNTGLKIDGASIYRVKDSNLLIYGAKGQSSIKVVKTLDGSDLLNKDIVAMLKANGENIDEVETQGIVTKKGDGISVSDEIIEIGEMELVGKTSQQIKQFVASVLEIKRVMGIMYGQKTIIDLKSVTDLEKLRATIYNGRARKVISKEQYDKLNLTEADIESLRQEGIEIYIDNGEESLTESEIEIFKNAKIAGQIIRDKQGIRIRDYNTEEEIKIEEILEEQNIESKILTAETPIMIDINILAKHFKQGNVTAVQREFGALLGKIKMSLNLGELNLNDIENMGYNISFNRIPVLTQDRINELFVKAGTEFQIENKDKLIEIIGPETEFSIILKTIKNKDTERRFKEIVIERILAKSALTENNKEFGLKDKYLEMMLGKMLLEQVNNTNKENINIPDNFMGDKDSVMRKIMEENEKATKGDETAINTIIEIILVYGDSYKERQVAKDIDKNDIRKYRSMMAAA